MSTPFTSRKASGFRHVRRERQRGQALIYGIFFLVAGLASLFFLFNTGQLSIEKTKLVNTADAVVYSAGIMHARTLNYEAYTNRAMLANTVAIAQLVSVSSWVQYTNNMTQPVGFTQFMPYYPSYTFAQMFGQMANASLISSSALKDLAEGSDDIIQNVLMTAQQAAYLGLFTARQDVMNDVAAQNYLGDGTVTVEVLPSSLNALDSFVNRYGDDDRTRFADISVTAAKIDSFVKKRSWAMPSMYPTCLFYYDSLVKRGGTELVGFDEWKAIDSMDVNLWSYNFWTGCGMSPVPGSWGAQTAADDSTMDLDPSHYDYALPINPSGTAMALVDHASDWSYSGIPEFFDLAQGLLDDKDTDPRLKFAIRVRRAIGQTATSEGTSAIKPAPGAGHGLNQYKAAPAGGSELVAVAGSEVYFQRPPVGTTNISPNLYGKNKGKPDELASLFNPYWQVRLSRDQADINTARNMQGAGSL